MEDGPPAGFGSVLHCDGEELQFRSSGSHRCNLLLIYTFGCLYCLNLYKGVQKFCSPAVASVVSKQLLGKLLKQVPYFQILFFLFSGLWYNHIKLHL